MKHLELLLRKHREDEQFRRLAVGSTIFNEMIAEAIMKDRTGRNYQLAPHNAPGIDLIADNGSHVQVKTVNSPTSFVAINRGRDNASEIMIIANFVKPARFFLLPMDQFKMKARPRNSKGRTVDRAECERWELSAPSIKRGELDQFEIKVDLE